MKKWAMGVFAFCLFAGACQNNSAVPPDKTADSTKNFFPIADFIRSEIRWVDSMPLAIVLYHIQGGKTDSAFIQAPAFNELAREFLPAALDSPGFEKNFSEVSFFDQTTNSLTFTYSPKSDTISLRRVDVIASEQPGSGKVKSIYMEETQKKKDTLFIKKMFWKPRKSFRVLTITQTGLQPRENKQIKVVWDSDE